MNNQKLAQKVYKKFKASGAAEVVAMDGRSIVSEDPGISSQIGIAIECGLNNKEFAYVTDDDTRWYTLWDEIVNLAYWDSDYDDIRME